MLALQDNIKKFEDKYGEIKVGKNQMSPQFKISKDNLPNQIEAVNLIII